MTCLGGADIYVDNVSDNGRDGPLTTVRCSGCNAHTTFLGHADYHSLSWIIAVHNAETRPPRTWTDDDVAPIRNLFHTIASIEHPDDVASFMDYYVAWLAKADLGDKDPADVARSNIGYVIGYDNDPEWRAAKHKLFNAAHPVFGGSY